MFRGRRGSVDWEIDTSRLNRILSNLPWNRRNAVRAIAFAIERKAKILAPVDTGALRNSIYVRVGREPTPLPIMGSERQMEASEGARVELPEPENDSVAHIGPSVEYALYQELGTRNMAAHPFLGPAINQAVVELAQHMLNVVTDGE